MAKPVQMRILLREVETRHIFHIVLPMWPEATGKADTRKVMLCDSTTQKDIQSSYHLPKTSCSTAYWEKQQHPHFPVLWNVIHFYFHCSWVALGKHHLAVAAGYFLQKIPSSMVQKWKRMEIFRNSSKMLGNRYHNYFLAQVGFPSGFYIMNLYLH